MGKFHIGEMVRIVEPRGSFDGKRCRVVAVDSSGFLHLDGIVGLVSPACVRAS